MKRPNIAKKILTVLLIALTLTAVGCSADKKILKNFELSDTEITLMDGQTKELILSDLGKYDPGEFTVTWKSEKPEIASINENGTVTAVSVGECTVYALIKTEKSEVKFPCTVTVEENTIQVTGMSFGAAVYALGAGQTLNLKGEITLEPADAAMPNLHWDSSNPSIATVAEGIVTPISPGISTITATTEDGTTRAQCIIQVSGIEVAASGITLDESEFTLYVGQTLPIPYKITPENATGYSLSWSSSDPEIAEMTGSAVTGKSEGEVTVTARLKIGNAETTVTCIVTVEKASSDVPVVSISITPNSILLYSNDAVSHKLKADITPVNHTQTVSWTTNREDLIELNGRTGEFSLKKAPKEMTAVIITCSAGDVSTDVIVVITPAVELEMDCPKLTLYDHPPKNTQKLAAELSGGDKTPTLTWVSSNPQVATVDNNGNVTAVKAGKCNITASFRKDGETYTATCELTVEEAPYFCIKVGESVTVTFENEPDPGQATTWVYNKDYMDIDPKTRKITAKKTTNNELFSIMIMNENGSTFAIYNICILPANS